MKHAIKTTILALTTISSLAQAGGPSCGKPVPLDIKPVLAANIQGMQSSARYSDIIARCSNYVTDLKGALTKSNYLARAGQLGRASDLLFVALTTKTATIPGVGETDAPHTIAALRGAVVIANSALKAAKSEDGRLGTTLTNQVRYSTLAELVKLVIQAYEQLDAPYYFNPSNYCRYNCGGGYYEDTLPREYYDGVSNLAHQFLGLQVTMASMQASDKVELAISRAVVKSSKDILLNSVFRRSFACTITSLHNLENDITEQLSCGGYMSDVQFVDLVRAQIREAYNNTYPRHRCGGY